MITTSGAQTPETPLPGTNTLDSPESRSESIPAPSNGSSGPATQPPIGCSGCGTRWSGLNTCHCGGCHETFTSVGAFDRHRRGGKCLDPAEIGLVPANKPWTGWSWPGTWTGPEVAA